MASYQKIFDRIAGLQNNIPEYRLFTQKYDPSNPEVTIPASDGLNMMLDDSGSPFRRPGYFSVDEAVWHSLFCDNGEAVGVRGQDLVLLQDDGYRILASGITSRTSFAQVNDEIYYTAGANQGRVVAGRHEDWPEIPHFVYETDRSFVRNFPATLVAFWLARVWLARDNFIVCSEPLGFGAFDLHQNTIMFDDEVTMMRPVADGMFVSTTKKIYFLHGKEPNGLERKDLVCPPVHEWAYSQVLVPANEVGMDPKVGDVALWAAEDGIYAGLSGGAAVNLTDQMVEFPRGHGRGACAPHGGQLFFCIDK